MLMSALEDKELIQLVELNWNSSDLEKQLAMRLYNSTKINEALKVTIKKTDYLLNKDKVLLTHDVYENVDLNINSFTPIFLHFLSVKKNCSFESYFHKNLNPDVANVGFLEQLDDLIQTSKTRPVKIYAIDDKEEISYFNTIKNYVNSQ